MKINISEKWLPVYDALASPVRLKIINLLAQTPMNIKELAGKLNLSSAIVTMHVKKLEKAHIISSERVNIRGTVQKQCKLVMDHIEVEFPARNAEDRKCHTFSVPIGQYTSFSATPTCGLATVDKVIGYFDDPRYFLDTRRVNAGILWFTKGFVEYMIPNYLLSSQEPEELEISLELGSEAPGVNSKWPSDITFTINGIKVGEWTSPGDFGGTKGKYTPDWWSLKVGQFGLLKVLRINSEGTFIDGQKVSNVTLDAINIKQKQWSLRISVEEEAKNKGGLTLFGKGFGNYDQDIVLKLYYK